MSEARRANRTLFHGDNMPFLRAMNSEPACPRTASENDHMPPDVNQAPGHFVRDRTDGRLRAAEWGDPLAYTVCLSNICAAKRIVRLVR